MNIKNIFPTPIGHFNDVEFTNKVLPIANSILDKTKENRLGYTNTYGDEKTQNYLKSLNWITSYIEKISYQYIDIIGFGFKNEIKVDVIFVSKINNTQNHNRHVHQHSVITGVIYLETTKGCAPLRFEDPRSVRGFNNMVKTEDKLDTNLNLVDFNPQSGDIVLFESWVPHSVPGGVSDGYRKTLVFNVDYK